MRRSPFGASSASSAMQAAVVVEQLLGLVAFHPAFKQRDMIGMRGIHQDRHLMRPEGALDLQAIDDLRSGPALGRPQHDHRPTRPGGVMLARAFFWIRFMSSMAFSRVAAIS